MTHDNKQRKSRTNLRSDLDKFESANRNELNRKLLRNPNRLCVPKYRHNR